MVGHGDGCGAGTEEFDELAHHLLGAQDGRDVQHQVGGRDAFAQLAGEFEAHHVGREHVDRLAQHGGLGLDAAHAPADHADAVDHGGVAVGADQRVGVVSGLVALVVRALVDAAREVLEIHLVHDAEARRHHAEGIEGLHAPLHELVALVVALELQLHVQVERLGRAVVVDHHRVIDHQVDGHQRLDGLGRLAQLGGHAAHGGQVGQQRHAGEVLQHHAGDDERNLVGALRVGRPVRQLFDVLGRNLLPVAIAQHRFEHDANGNRQPVDGRVLLGQLLQGPVLAGLARCCLEGLEGGRKGMRRCFGHRGTPVCSWKPLKDSRDQCQSL